MLFIKDWNKASLDKSSNSIVTKYKSKINSLTDKTDALRKLLEELYDEAVILNERIKIDKQAIQEDLNDTANDLRETCGNSSWGQNEIKKAQDSLDRAEEDIEDIKTDIEITTGCLVVCQSSQESGCNQPVPCNETPSIPEDCTLANCVGFHTDEPEEDCVVIVNGEFDCTGADSYVDECYGGCDGDQSCDSQTKVCPKCHGSDVDIIETCTECDTDQKTTCGTFDDQAGCESDNEDGNCNKDNENGDCNTVNKEGDCYSNNESGDCIIENKYGNCSMNVHGTCSLANEAPIDDSDVCASVNFFDDSCDKENVRGDCITRNYAGDCYHSDLKGTCVLNDHAHVCLFNNDVDQRTCKYDDTNADYCNEDNSESSDCFKENSYNDCNSGNKNGNCNKANTEGNCYSENATGNCTTNNMIGNCDTQSCEAGQECVTCIEDQKETTTTEKCEAGANIGDEEYCDTCQGDESKEEEWDQEELEDLCSNIFDKGADACSAPFSSCFNVGECDGASFGAAAGCGTGQGCGACNEDDSCSGGQECATGQTCYSNDCGEDCGQCGSCYGGGDDCGQPCNETCYPVFGCSGGQECRLGYTPGCGEGVVCPGGTYNGDCGQWGGEDI